MHVSSVLSRRPYLIVALAAATWGLAAPALASEPETPTTLAGGKVITPTEGNALLDKKAVFIDTRSAVNFGKGHVPGALALPYKGNSENVPNFDVTQDQFDLSKLPGNKEQALVFYSDSPTGWKSYKAAVLAIKAGHRNVHYMREGWAGWKAQGLRSE